MQSEFRQNLVSGEWVLNAPGRAKRPHEFKFEAINPTPKETCPFENPEQTGHQVIWRDSEGPDWQVTLLENKFPALTSGVCGADQIYGPFNTHPAVGRHELFVFRDHDRQLHQYDTAQMTTVLRAYQRRMNELATGQYCAKYISLFHNFGPAAGASLWHPHSQVMAMPIVPPLLTRRLAGAQKYFQTYRQRVYDTVLAWEQSENTRILHQNEHFIAYCPFASSDSGEIVISGLTPATSGARFEDLADEYLAACAETLATSLQMLARALGSVPYNFFILTAPVRQSGADTTLLDEAFSWHIEIYPKLNIDAGFELSTGVQINTVDPTEFAKLLQQKTNS